MGTIGSRRSGEKKQRRYSSRDRSAAVVRSREVGLREAAKELGIPLGTVGFWRFLEKRGVLAGALPEGKSVVGSETVSGQQGSGQGESGQGAVGGSATESLRNRGSGQSKATEGKECGTAPEGWKPRPKGVARKYTPSERAGAGGKGEHPLASADLPSTKDKAARVVREWETHRGLGPSRIRNQLRREGLKVSVHFVRQVMEGNGYVMPTVSRKEVHDRRYEAVRPNQLWHADFRHRHVNKLPVYVLLVLDDFSRFVVGASMWEGERVEAVLETFEEAVARHGRPEAMMSDGGSAFYAWRGVGQFTRRLEEYGVDQLIAKVPQVNGKSEILNANLGKELFNQERFFDLGEAQRRLAAWVEFYNLRRTHHALGGLLVPGDRYFGRADRVLNAVEAGRNPEGIGEPVPPELRTLDFLRVSSRGGQVEVFLMGERLWPPAALK